MRFKAIYKTDSQNETVVGIYDKKEMAIMALLNKGEHNYCLDSREERYDALVMRGFCMCGCGPSSMKIEEID